MLGIGRGDDPAGVRTAQGKLYLIVAIDRTSKFAFGSRPCENSASDSVSPRRATVVAIFSHAARPIAFSTSSAAGVIIAHI
jgi:hypothetical protein